MTEININLAKLNRNAKDRVIGPETKKIFKHNNVPLYTITIRAPYSQTTFHIKKTQFIDFWCRLWPLFFWAIYCPRDYSFGDNYTNKFQTLMLIFWVLWMYKYVNRVLN